MRSIDVEVRNAAGLPARPAAAGVRAAARFVSTVRLANVTLGRPSADGKSIVGILTLGVEKGHVLRVVTEGTDEDRAVETLRDLLASRPEKAGQ